MGGFKFQIAFLKLETCQTVALSIFFEWHAYDLHWGGETKSLKQAVILAWTGASRVSEKMEQALPSLLLLTLQILKLHLQLPEPEGTAFSVFASTLYI